MSKASKDSIRYFPKDSKKMLSITNHQGKTNQNHNITSCLLGELLSRWHQMLARMWSNRNAYSLLVEMQNGTATLKYSLLFTELNILLPYDSAITFLSICSNELKICLLGIMHTNNYSNFIHNWPHSEATKMSSNRWMDK